MQTQPMFDHILNEVNSSYFFAESYTVPSLWTNLYRLSLYAVHSSLDVTLVPDARPFLNACYKDLHAVLREALLLSDIPPHDIRSMGVRDETNWRYQPLVLSRVLDEFHDGLYHSRDILLSNFSAPAVTFSFFEPLRMLVMGFERCQVSSESVNYNVTMAAYCLKYVAIPSGVPVSNNPPELQHLYEDLLRLTTLQEYLDMIGTHVATENNNGMCVICQEDFEVGQDIRYLPCEHSFHSNCVDEWLLQNGSCPLDRIRI